MISQPLLILAGGFGTRLRTVLTDRPKPLAPIGEAPFLEILLAGWVKQGVHDFVFLLHHQAQQVIDLVSSLASTSLKDCRCTAITEPTPLGTGGAVAFAVQQLGLQDSFLVANADTWLGAGLRTLAAKPAPSLAMIQVSDTSRYGRLLVDDQGVVTAFIEKQQTTGPGGINAGLYHLLAADFLNWNGHPFSLERDYFPSLVHKQSLHAIALDTDFIDIGIPDDYHRFTQWYESGRVHQL